MKGEVAIAGSTIVILGTLFFALFQERPIYQNVAIALWVIGLILILLGVLWDKQTAKLKKL